jgi:transcriptional regulator with XRE-family HTH domain
MNHNAHRERVGLGLEEIRRMIEESGLSERKIAIRAGLSPGYVTQLLTGKPELKIWHLLAILDALRCNPSDFFRKVYGRQRSALAEISETAKNTVLATMPELDDWFVEPVRGLKTRLAHVEKVLGQFPGIGIKPRRSRPARRREATDPKQGRISSLVYYFAALVLYDAFHDERSAGVELAATAADLDQCQAKELLEAMHEFGRELKVKSGAEDTDPEIVDFAIMDFGRPIRRNMRAIVIPLDLWEKLNSAAQEPAAQLNDSGIWNADRLAYRILLDSDLPDGNAKQGDQSKAPRKEHDRG